MTLAQAAVGMSDQTASSVALSIAGSHLEPRCHVCRTDEVRQRVNDLLASGASYATILHALGSDAVGVSTDSIRRHADRHFPVQNAARATYREILERRAQENGVDFANGVATAITPMAYLETLMVKGYAKLVDPDTEVDLKTGMAAACRRQEMVDSHGDQADWVKTRAEMGRIVEVVRTFIPSEKWPAVQAALRGDAPIGDTGPEEERALRWWRSTTGSTRMATDVELLRAGAGLLASSSGRQAT